MGLPSTVDGIDCAAIRVMGLRISKPIGAPSSCTVTFEDTTFVLPRTLGKLAELVVGPLSANRFVSNAAMKVGAYTLLNSAPADGPRRVTVRHTSIGDTDTLGTLTIVGTDADGAPLTETLAIGADTTVSHGLTVGSEGFLTVESITGAGWAVVGEPDRVTIGCKGRTLFRGQLTNDNRTSLQPGLRHAITAEGYQRLLPKSIVAPLLDVPRTVMSDNESSLINELAYDTGVDGAGMSDGEIIRELLRDVGDGHGCWEGPTLDTSDVQSFMAPDPVTGLAFDPPLRFSNIGVDAAISAMQTRLTGYPPPATVFWIDDDLCAHYKVLEIGPVLDYGYMSLGRPELANPAPYKLGMSFYTDDMGYPVIMPMTLEDSTDHGDLIRTIQHSGTTPWTVLTLTEGPTHGGRESISSSAVTSEDAMNVAWWTAKDRRELRTSGTARIAAGFDGWEPGQMLSLTEGDLYPTETWFPVRTVGIDLMAAGDSPTLEYVLDYGDTGRRSYVRESEDNYKGVTPGIDRAIYVRVDAFDFAPDVGSLQLLRAQCVSATGEPMQMPKRTIVWALFVNGADVGIGDEVTIGWWLSGTWDGEPVGTPGSTLINPDSGYAYCALNRGAASVDGDYVDVRATLQDVL